MDGSQRAQELLSLCHCPPAPPQPGREICFLRWENSLEEGIEGNLGTGLEEEEERFLEGMREGGNSEVLATSPYPPGAWV